MNEIDISNLEIGLTNCIGTAQNSPSEKNARDCRITYEYTNRKKTLHKNGPIHNFK